MVCIFCNGICNEIYKMSEYGICQCRKCKTATVDNLPEENELEEFYQGFLFQANRENLSSYGSSDMLNYLSSFNLRKNSQMLDVGGGGGFMAKIFEKSGFGDGHYIDLDGQACSFAKHELGLNNVYNKNIHDLPDEINNTFDFIYSRHVIEHVLDPPKMVYKMIDMLKPGGILEMILPNGRSLEYLGYPALLEYRINKITTSNKGWSKGKILRSFFSGKIAHGIDPIRHLWAITDRGIDAILANKKNISYRIKTAPLSDPVYSIYYAATLNKDYRKKLQAFFINNTLVRMFGGCHMIVTIKKTGSNNSGI